jgi:membrane protein
MISLASVFLGREAMAGQVFWRNKRINRKPAAAQIQDVIKNTTLSGENYLSIIVGSVTLLIELPQFWRIKDSIKFICKTKARW